MPENPVTIETLEFVGGSLALDFANTGSERVEGGVVLERLRSYADVVTFAQRMELVGEERGKRLLEEAARRPADAARVHAQAIGLRECIFRVFTAVATGGRPADGDVEELNGFLAEGMRHRRLERDARCCGWSWSAGEEPLAQMLWPIAHDAAELLVAGQLERVKRCEGGTCDWLFVDLSRNRSRRWCDMKDCGNRVKARRHYARHRGG
jgi:predicted RNA-binding Zn ribbon-like protein